MKSNKKSSFIAGFSQNFAKKRRFFAAKTHKSSFYKGYCQSFKSIKQASSKNRALTPSIIAALTFVIGIMLGTHIVPVAISSASGNTKIETLSPAPKPAEKPLKDAAVQSEVQDKPISMPSNSSTNYYNYTNRTNANPSNASSSSAYTLNISTLGINAPIIKSNLTNKELSVPAYGVSYYQTLYMGHSSGVFANLQNAKIGSKVTLGNKSYTISDVRINLPVSENRQAVGNFSMGTLTNLPNGKIVLMTCSGSYRSGFGWTGRTLVFANLD